jgi:hypothetical protein
MDILLAEVHGSSRRWNDAGSDQSRISIGGENDDSDVGLANTQCVSQIDTCRADTEVKVEKCHSRIRLPMKFQGFSG